MTLEEMNELKNYYTIPKKQKEKKKEKKRALSHGQSVCDENFSCFFLQNKQEVQQ